MGKVELRTKLHPILNDWYVGGELMQTTYVDEDGCESGLYHATPTGECYFMTVTEIATGESDPWGVTVNFDTYNYVTEEETGFEFECHAQIRINKGGKRTTQCVSTRWVQTL